MSRSPRPASDITRDTERDFLYYDSHHVRHDSADKVLQIAVKVNTTKQKHTEQKAVPVGYSSHQLHCDSQTTSKTFVFLF